MPESAKKVGFRCFFPVDESKLIHPKSDYRSDYTEGVPGFKSGDNNRETGGVIRSEAGAVAVHARIFTGMDQHEMQVLECGGMRVAASVETYDRQEHQQYFPDTVLLFVQQGEFTIRLASQFHRVPANSFCLVRKHTLLNVTKSWSAGESGFRMFAFIFQDEFIRGIILSLPLPNGPLPDQPVVALPRTPILTGLVQSIMGYFDGTAEVERQLIQLKTFEALLGITQHRPDLVGIFHELTLPIRADLPQFMTYHLTSNIPLKELARLSGRSLSTFNRDFRKLFQLAPHQWIRQQRLTLAKQLLVQTSRKPSDIYLEVGFEDLAHFSRSFKQFFGQNPSDFLHTPLAVLDK